MNKEILSKLINQGLSQRKIASTLNISQTTVRYWCKKYKLKAPPKETAVDKFCSRCQTRKPIKEFYPRRSRKNGTFAYCKSCATAQTTERAQRLKRLCVDYKGGKCMDCGYNRCIAALDFHHREKENKEFNIAHIKSYIFGEDIKKELDKCDLVCCRCHRERHYLTAE